jgi:transcription elongation factor Elf1
MNDGDKRRKAIFDKFADNLKLLIDIGVLTGVNLKYDRTYICPICTDQFSVDALNQNVKNPLTLEDAPPKSLGGKANILTCKSCNNSCGHKIDYHLTERMRELDRSQFLPKTEFNAKFEQDGTMVQGTIRIEEDGKITAIHKNKTNHPSKLAAYIKSVLPDRIINLTFLKTQVEPFKLQLALLKTGFLMTFSKYGYAFILNPTYDRIRQQLLNPDNEIYPTEFWFQPPYPREIYGVPFIIESGLEAILPIFPLTTNSSERPFATIIPLTIKPIEETIAELKNRFKQTSSFSVTMDPMGPNTDYFTNVEAITKMRNWIDSKTKQP